VGAILVFAIVGAVWVSQRDKARLAELQKWALANDWKVVRRPAVDWARRLRERDEDRVAFAIYGLVDGRSVAIAECDFTSRSNISGRRLDRYVLLVAQLRQPARTVAVHRRAAWEKSDRQLTRDRPTSVGVDAFDQEYRVVAPDRRAARAVLGQRLIVAHVAGEPPDWSVQGTEVLMYRRGHIGALAEIPRQFTSIMRVADLIEADAGESPHD
jgi:hypothetical protein